MDNQRLQELRRQIRREDRGSLWSRVWPVAVVAAMMWTLVFVAAGQV